MALNGKREKRRSAAPAGVVRMLLFVKSNVPLDPVDVGTLNMPTVVLDPYAIADLVEQLGFSCRCLSAKIGGAKFVAVIVFKG